MAGIIGVIMYTHLGDGCITGKYQNNGINPQTECLAKIGVSDKIWEGRYNAAWLEGRKAQRGIVEIEKVRDGYKLTWVKGNQVLFYGHGMIVDENKLVVSYWDGEVEHSTKIFPTIK